MRASVDGMIVFEDYSPEPRLRWEAFSDEVAGGGSTVKRAAILEEDGLRFARLEGRVVPGSGGGFIQVRAYAPGGFLDSGGHTRLVMIARSSPGFYAVHLRTPRCVAPWAYYGAPFPVGAGWTELSIPFDAFEAAEVEPGPLETGILRSLAFLALAAPGGRAYEARLDVARIHVE